MKLVSTRTLSVFLLVLIVMEMVFAEPARRPKGKHRGRRPHKQRRPHRRPHRRPQHRPNRPKKRPYAHQIVYTSPIESHKPQTEYTHTDANPYTPDFHFEIPDFNLELQAHVPKHPENSYKQPETSYKQPQTDYKQPETSYKQPETSYKQPETSYKQPETSYKQPETRYKQPETGYKQPETSYKQPETSYKQPETSYKQPETGYKQPETSYKQPETGYKQPETSYKQPETSYKQPETGYKQPETRYKQPQTGYKHPETSHKQPEISYEEPETSYKQPESSYKQPETGYKQPETSYKQPETSYKQPETSYKQPETSYKQPETGYKQPESSYKQPETSYKQPETTYKQPETSYKQPETSYKQPETGYKQPETRYKQPQTGYKHPETSHKQPEISYKQPETSYKQPETSYKQPETSYKQSEISYNQPETNYKQPQTGYNQPKIIHKEPATAYQQHQTNYKQEDGYERPGATYKQPAVVYKQPEVTYREPESTYNPITSHNIRNEDDQEYKFPDDDFIFPPFPNFESLKTSFVKNVPKPETYPPSLKRLPEYQGKQTGNNARDNPGFDSHINTPDKQAYNHPHVKRVESTPQGPHAQLNDPYTSHTAAYATTPSYQMTGIHPEAQIPSYHSPTRQPVAILPGGQSRAGVDEHVITDDKYKRQPPATVSHHKTSIQLPHESNPHRLPTQPGSPVYDSHANTEVDYNTNGSAERDSTRPPASSNVHSKHQPQSNFYSSDHGQNNKRLPISAQHDVPLDTRLMNQQDRYVTTGSVEHGPLNSHHQISTQNNHSPENQPLRDNQPNRQDDNQLYKNGYDTSVGSKRDLSPSVKEHPLHRIAQLPHNNYRSSPETTSLHAPNTATTQNQHNLALYYYPQVKRNHQAVENIERIDYSQGTFSRQPEDQERQKIDKMKNIDVLPAVKVLDRKEDVELDEIVSDKTDMQRSKKPTIVRLFDGDDSDYGTPKPSIIGSKRQSRDGKKVDNDKETYGGSEWWDLR